MHGSDRLQETRATVTRSEPCPQNLLVERRKLGQLDAHPLRKLRSCFHAFDACDALGKTIHLLHLSLMTILVIITEDDSSVNLTPP